MIDAKVGRRGFLKRSTLWGAGIMAAPSINVLGANERVNVAVIGVGGRGGGHVHHFNNQKNVEVVAVCDADTKHMDKFENIANKHQDYRDVLDMKDVDAVVIASPNHWHAAATVFACQAGKHVYVEKPLSHSIWGGQQMEKAAKKYKRIVQAGTQQRSCPAPNAAGADIRAGKYGKVKWVHCMKLNKRAPIGLVKKPQPVPDHIDYNLWAGPAPKTPVMRERFHYDWHWQWNWGDGEMGNWAVHYIDDLCNMLAWKHAPTSVITAGGRFVWKDNGNTPNMEFSLMEHNGMPIVVEIRDLPHSSGRGSPGVYMGRRGGNIIQCEDAVIKIARGGGAAFDNNGKKIKDYPGNGGRGHASNFIDAVRSGNSSDLNAPVEGGVLSSLICQQANISYRLGKKASIDQIRQSMKDHEDALNTIESVTQQIERNDGELSKMRLGPKLEFDKNSEKFVGANSDAANAFLRYEMREEFAIPETV